MSCGECATAARYAGYNGQQPWGRGVHNNALIFKPQQSILGVFQQRLHSSSAPSKHLKDYWSLLLDTGCEKTAIQVEHSDKLLDYREYPHNERPPFLPNDASGTAIPMVGEGRLSESLPGTAYTMNVQMDLLAPADFKEHWLLIPPENSHHYDAYIVNEDGRVLVVAANGLKVYPELNDQMIQGIPRISMPVIKSRDESVWGPEGHHFVPNWTPPSATYALRSGYTIHPDEYEKTSATFSGDYHYHN